MDQYRKCDVLVAPSTGQESFGIVLLEAMASGRAIVCSDIEGYREVVDDQGALLVKPRDVSSLEAAIASLALDPERVARMGDWNRRRVPAFDWRALAPRVRCEYEAAIANPDDPFPIPEAPLAENRSPVQLDPRLPT